jgi:hypothetical protein
MDTTLEVVYRGRSNWLRYFELLSDDDGTRMIFTTAILEDPQLRKGDLCEIAQDDGSWRFVRKIKNRHWWSPYRFSWFHWVLD